MKKVARGICLAIALTAAMMLLWGAECEAQARHDVVIKLDITGASADIGIATPGNRFVGLCGKWSPAAAVAKKRCRGNEIKWKLEIHGSGGPGAGLGPNEEVKILNAPNHPACFSTIPFTFDNSNTSPPNTPPFTHESGPPDPSCSQDKYGTYWPYVIEYWKDGYLEASTDPGGIIFP